jgi:hypothetical protein
MYGQLLSLSLSLPQIEKTQYFVGKSRSGRGRPLYSGAKSRNKTLDRSKDTHTNPQSWIHNVVAEFDTQELSDGHNFIGIRSNPLKNLG